MASKIVLATGANRGIGFCIMQLLAQRAKDNIYLLGARDPQAGEEATKQLRAAGITAKVEVVRLDVTNDESVFEAAAHVEKVYGKLDVLVNNAGVAKIPNTDGSDWREVYNYTFNGNITSVAIVTKAFMGLLKKSSDPRVINISSARGSIERSIAGKLPPTAAIPYSVSKTALSMLTIEMAKTDGGILFQCACPGHCKTAFNGYRGTKDPMDGARVAVELALSEREKYGSGFWEYEEDGMRQVPW